MKSNYIITNTECAEKGLDLNDYAIDGTTIPAIINKALDTSITRMCELCDNLECEEDIEEKLDAYPKKVKAFKKLQYNVIWLIIFTATDYPVDEHIDAIISHELNLGKINGIQKGLYYRHN